MTLRGELDSFPLETVVQLIHSTNKTGQLEVRGSDASGGTLGFDGGRLIAAIAGDDAGEPALGVIFAVGTGAFEFIPWNEPPAANLSGDLDQLLDKAAEERDRIVAIRKVIPDDRARFRLSERAAEKGNITLAPDQWRTLLAVNGERDLTGVADHLKAGKLATRSTLAALVEAGFIDVLEPAADAAPPAPAAKADSQQAAWEELVERVERVERVEPVERVEQDQWSPFAPGAVAPAPEPQTWAPPAPEPEREPEPAPATEPQAWEQPRQGRPDPEQPAAQPDLRADLAAALDARMSAPPTPVVEPETPLAPAPIDIPPEQDERLAALSGVFAPAQPAAMPVEPPAPEPPRSSDRINEWARLTPEIEAEPAPAEETKKGLFGFLKRDEPAEDPGTATAPPTSIAAGVGRAGQLASLSNALLAEYNSGHYGKGRLDDRMANLLMRVDEQADPIDRPLPVVDDRIDAQAVDRENMPEQQAVPYLAMLVSQIYEDAERTFGKEKAKRGYRTARKQVFGADATALNAPDVAGRLPKV